MQYSCEQRATVVVEVHDQDAIDRCVHNHDTDGVPQPDDDRGRGWRNTFYDLRDESDVIEHFAFNALANGVNDASQLDGWADLPRGAVTMQVSSVHFQGYLASEKEGKL